MSMLKQTMSSGVVCVEEKRKSCHRKHIWVCTNKSMEEGKPKSNLILQMQKKRKKLSLCFNDNECASSIKED